MINALLEGSLPPQLSALDPAMPLQTAPAQQSANGNVKAPAEGVASLGNTPLHCNRELHTLYRVLLCLHPLPRCGTVHS